MAALGTGVSGLIAGEGQGKEEVEKILEGMRKRVGGLKRKVSTAIHSNSCCYRWR